jgi:hypothetical protein
MPFIFFDWETQSNADLKITGSLKYALDPSTRPLLQSFCIDDGPVHLWCPDLEAELHPEVWAYVRSRMRSIGGGKERRDGERWRGVPREIVDALNSPGGYTVAWNHAFDRHIWQQVATPDFGFPELKIEHTLDAMAQAQASNLPGQLDWAGRKLGLGNKTLGGKAVMMRFADGRVRCPAHRSWLRARTPGSRKS